MELEGTLLVREEHVRPARPDGTCFYCSRPVGEWHGLGCVIPSRTVVVRVSVDVIVSVPLDWQERDVRFHYNDSSWCADNILRDLGEWAQAEDDCSRPGCSCSATSVEFLREADEDDDSYFPRVLA